MHAPPIVLSVCLVLLALSACGQRPPAVSGAPVGPAPRHDVWRIIGMGGGGTVRLVRASPHDPSMALAVSDMTDAFITRDGGRSWRTFYLLDSLADFAFDPSRREVVYALNQALWRSDDGGGAWRMVFPDPASVNGVAFVTDDAEAVLRSSDPASQIWHHFTRLAVDPQDPQRLYATTAEGRIGRSDDGGASWRELATGVGEVLLLDALPGDPLAVCRDGIRLGAERLPPPGRSIVAAASGRDRAGARWLYATTPLAAGRGGIFRSLDDGRTWTDLTPGLLALGTFPATPPAAWYHVPALRTVACCPTDPATVYLGFQGLLLDGRPHNGIAALRDGAWSIVHAEGEAADPRLSGSYVEERAPHGQPNLWFDAPWSLAVPAGDGRVAWAADCFRVYRTGDGGGSWQQVHSVATGGGAWSTAGIDVTTSYGVHWDPFDLQHVFITYTDMGLHHSHDGGATWLGASAGMPELWRNTSYWIAFDPEVRGLLWSASALNHDLPRPRMFRGQGTGTFDGGVCVSRDGGATWAVAGTGLPPMACTHILLDPASPVGARTLYACGFGRGVFKSVDGGATWQRRSDGIAGDQPLAWRLTRAGDGTLYLVVARRSEDGRIGDAGDGALYRSTDGAATWTRLPLPAGCNGPTGLEVDPRDPQRLYLTLWGRFAPSGDAGGGIQLSTDGGATWTPIFERDQHVYALTIDGRAPDRLFACGFEGSAWRSDDAGRNWRRLQGYNFKPGHRVCIDPRDPGRIFITTFGNSVWTGPADGDPTAPEDLVGPPPWRR